MLRPDPIPELKKRLAEELVNALKGWQPTDVMARFGLDQPRVWELRHARLQRFSLQRLVRLLVELDRDIIITVQPRGPARTSLAKANPGDRPRT